MVIYTVCVRKRSCKLSSTIAILTKIVQFCEFLLKLSLKNILFSFCTITLDNSKDHPKILISYVCLILLVIRFRSY